MGPVYLHLTLPAVAARVRRPHRTPPVRSSQTTHGGPSGCQRLTRSQIQGEWPCLGCVVGWNRGLSAADIALW